MGREHLRVFVATGNSAPFARLLRATRQLPRNGTLDLFVQRGAGGDAFRNLPGEDFISREAFAERLAWADVVVCHAGAGSLYEAYFAGHTPIAMPRLARLGEHVNDHQLELARALALGGHAILCEPEHDLAELIHAAPRRQARRQIRRDRLTSEVRNALLADDAGESQPALASMLWAVSCGLLRRARRWGFWHGESTANDRSA